MSGSGAVTALLYTGTAPLKHVIVPFKMKTWVRLEDVVPWVRKKKENILT